MKTLTDLAAFLYSLDEAEGKRDTVEVYGGDPTPLGFDMRTTFREAVRYARPAALLPEGVMDCGSACCIGGWVQAKRPDLRHLGVTEAVFQLARTELGVGDTLEEEDEANRLWHECDLLCHPTRSSDSGVSLNTYDAWEATPRQAARAVELLRDTRQSRWVQAMEEGKV